MDVKRVVLNRVILIILLFTITSIQLEEIKEKGNVYNYNDRGCAYLNCDRNNACIHRKFRCKSPPCPSMLYCAKSQTESLKGPATCDTVTCSTGFICTLKVRGCRWDNKCEQQIARCVSQKEFYEGPASCAGYKCPQGNHCILREIFCLEPPCKLLRSCAKNKDVQLWFGRCRTLGCKSEYECFLRRPDYNCTNQSCKHTPDCITNDDKSINEYCRGWICPRFQICFAETMGLCETNDCIVKRTCHDVQFTTTNNSSSVSFSRRSLNKEDEIPKKQPEQVKSERNETHYPWLNHLNSKAELDAIELWIKNAKNEEDFKQFQDWLRSIKNILKEDEYQTWLKEIRLSRGEEFRKWVEASHVEDEIKDTTHPGEKGAFNLTENLHRTSNILTDANKNSGKQWIFDKSYSNEDPIVPWKKSSLENKKEYFNEISVDFLEQLMKIFSFSSVEDSAKDYGNYDYERDSQIGLNDHWKSTFDQAINNNDYNEIDLNLFLEQNKESLLPYVETLMETINEETNISKQSTKEDKN